MDIMDLNKQITKEKTDQTEISKNIEQKKPLTINELPQDYEDDKYSEINTDVQPIHDISPKAILAIKKGSDKKNEGIQPVAVDGVNLREELSDEFISALSLAQKRTLIDKIKESSEIHGDEKLVQKLNLFNYVLTLKEEEGKRFRSVLKIDLNIHLNHFDGKNLIRIDSEKESFIYSNLISLINSCYKEDKLETTRQLDVSNSRGDAAFAKLNSECNGVFKQIDKNPMYDFEDKLIRKIELYKSYRASAMEAGREYQSRQTEMHRISFEYKLHLLEKQLVDYREKKKIASETIEKTERELESLNAKDPIYKIKQEELKRLKQVYKDYYTSSFATDVKALDQFENEEKNREADNTLDLLQIEKVRQIDRWLIQNAKDEYKEKGFMAEVMGCTARERLSMYLCLELNNKHLDQSTLIFSQTNYLPDLEAIKTNMVGWKIFRKMGFKGVSWSKVKWAFEYVTGKRAELKEIADIACNEQKKYEEKNQNGFTFNNDETGRGTIIEKKGKKVDTSGIQDDDLHANVLDLGKNLLADMQMLRNKKQGEAEDVKERYNRNLKELRALVDREKELAKTVHHKKFWDRYKTTLKVMGYIDYVPLAGSVVGSVSRSMDWMDEDHWLTKATDGTSYGGLYYSGAVQLATMVKTSADMIGHWKESSKSANAQRIMATTKSITPLANSIATIATVTKDYGVWADGYGKYRRAMSGMLKERVEGGKSAYLFDWNKTATYCQMVGSAMTVGSSAIDYYNIHRSRKACKTIREQIQNRNKDRGISKEYREATYKRSLARLMDGINVKKGITATTNIVNNAAGYMKYIISNSYIGIITTATTLAISVITGGIASYLKKKHDKKAIDAFLDIDQLANEYTIRYPGRVVDIDFTKKQMRRYAMMKLGFANTKSFFAHVAQKLGAMINKTLTEVNGEEARRNALPLVTILKSVGLAVDLTKGKIPDAKLIAKKLSE